jgi:hypothetical protein
MSPGIFPSHPISQGISTSKCNKKPPTIEKIKVQKTKEKIIFLEAHLFIYYF